MPSKTERLAADPANCVDLWGLSTEVVLNSEGNFVVTGGKADEDNNIYLSKDRKEAEEIIGQSLTPYSFLDNANEPVIGAIINLNDETGQEFIDNFRTKTPNLLNYMINARNGCKYDFKDLGISETEQTKDQYRYRGMPITDSSGNTYIASARDIGNYAAGYVAGNSGILSWEMTRLGFDLYNGGPEPQVTQQAQKKGFSDGNNDSCPLINK